MTSLRERFEAKLDRTGEHHLWTGSKLRDGSGKLKIGTRTVTARRMAWELAHGPLPEGVEIRACPDDKSCVRVEHLSIRGHVAEAPARRRAAPGEGSMDQVRPGVWKITITRGRHDNGIPRRFYRTIRADDEAEAARLKAAFIPEIYQGPLPDRQDARDMTLNETVERYLDHLRDEKGREERTIRGYRQIHDQWFAPEIGDWRVRDVDEDTIDRHFGKMRQAGLSRSRMNQAKSLYQPLFRWAKRRRIITRNPMADFELPKSRHVPRQRRPPEVEQLCRYLTAAVELVPDIAPSSRLEPQQGCAAVSLSCGTAASSTHPVAS